MKFWNWGPITIWHNMSRVQFFILENQSTLMTDDLSYNQTLLKTHSRGYRWTRNFLFRYSSVLRSLTHGGNVQGEAGGSPGGWGSVPAGGSGQDRHRQHQLLTQVLYSSVHSVGTVDFTYQESRLMVGRLHLEFLRLIYLNTFWICWAVYHELKASVRSQNVHKSPFYSTV